MRTPLPTSASGPAALHSASSTPRWRRFGETNPSGGGRSVLAKRTWAVAARSVLAKRTWEA